MKKFCWLSDRVVSKLCCDDVLCGFSLPFYISLEHLSDRFGHGVFLSMTPG